MSQIFLVIISLLIGFGGGYFVKSGSCTKSITNVYTQIAPTAAPTSVPAATIIPTVNTAAVANLTPTPPPLEKVFDTFNIAAVANKPSAEAVFTLTSAKKIYSVLDYHWNNARGKTPGTISLKSSDGKSYGPWNVVGAPGQGGVPDAYWYVYPNIELPAGTYTIVDSDPDSWAQNSGSKGVGMSQVQAVK